jgi:hypothetical protein
MRQGDGGAEHLGGDPARLAHGELFDERQCRLTAAEREQADDEESHEKIEIDHAGARDRVRSLRPRSVATRAPGDGREPTA